MSARDEQHATGKWHGAPFRGARDVRSCPLATKLVQRRECTLSANRRHRACGLLKNKEAAMDRGRHASAIGLP